MVDGYIDSPGSAAADDTAVDGDGDDCPRGWRNHD